MSKPTEMDPHPLGAFCHKINVTWGDCDPARIVYTGRLPWFALDAINGWWEAQLGGDGWFQLEVDRNLGTPFVRLEMDFARPVTPRHPLLCYVWPEHLGETSITFRVDGEQEGQRCFSSRSVNVFVTANAFKKCPPPVDLREIVLSAMADSAR
ncbi:hotdog domain-containing protein [Planktomarina temperata]|nr:hotdog domain-containing protein [Planktomarina temperata]